MRSKMAVVGCGGLGGLQASLLVRAGVGTVRIIDRDVVEESNLQRQLLFDEDDARSLRPKAAAAERRLRGVNSLVRVEGVVDDLNPNTIARLLGGFDVVLDATDNFDTRYLVNDYCVKTATPWVYGACVGADGMTFPILPGETPCLRCVFPDPPPPGVTPSCDTAGVLGSIVGVVASLQVAEAFKIAAGHRDLASRRLAIVDVWDTSLQTLDLPARDPHCPCCAEKRFDYLELAAGSQTTSLCGRDAVQVRARSTHDTRSRRAAERLRPLGRVERTRFLLRAEIDTYQLTIFSDGRALVGGTNDPAVAKSLYARYVGM